MTDGPLLLCYDGSDDAKRAIARAGELFGPRSAVVLSVWQPAVALATYGWAGIGAIADMADVDATTGNATRDLAAEGAELANAAGLNAEPEAVEAAGSVWQAILGCADSRGAVAIVMGSRGLTGIKSILLGSVSSNVVHHARRPTLVVPHLDA